MEISVIIAVFNAAEFINKAVESALIQPETAEVILIEDGSLDDSLKVCQLLQAKHEKVILYRHPNGKNCGAPASFNLGIKKSKYEYLAILGADDYYLPGRFTGNYEIFRSHPEIDGVYEAMGIEFENEEAKELWANSPMANIYMTTMTKNVKPDELFETLVLGRFGFFSLNGLTIKKTLIQKTGLMNENLRLHQDTDIIMKMSAIGSLVPGRLRKPVAIRRVHTLNRISAHRSYRQEYKNRMLMWMSIYSWLKKQGLSEKQKIVCKRLASYSMTTKHYDFAFEKFVPERILTRLRFLISAVEYPSLLLEPGYFKEFLPEILQTN